MFSAVDVASCIFYHYQDVYGKKIDEMKLHKLLYFVQRESFIQTGEPLFSEKFEAWKFGPVMVKIRRHYKDDDFKSNDIYDRIKSIIDTVFETYSNTGSWSLSMMSHEEISWQNARVGIPEGVNGNKTMANEDIKSDADRVKALRGI